MTLSNEPTLVCPKCAATLPRPFPTEPDTLNCAGCGTGYAFKGGVYRFVPTDGYAGSFGYQWKKRTPFYFGGEAEAGAERSLRKLHITPELVRGRAVLDAGCGMGRFSEVLSRWGANCVSVDLSESIDVAYSHLHDRKNIVFVQADLNKLPFPPATFDVILSWGVLHHTENTEAAFKAVVRHLKPGGKMGIFVYGRNKGFRRKMINTYRHLTRHMPRRLLYALCTLAGPLHYVYKIPVIGNILRELFPISRQATAQERIIETFDTYSPYYRWEHSFPEVQRWFVEAGATDVRIYDPPVNATGEFGIGGRLSS